VIVPIVVFAGGNLTDDSGPEPAPSPTPNPTVVDPSGSDFGYIEGKTIHLPNGSEINLPERYQGAAVLGETVFAVRNDDETGQLYLDVQGGDVFPTETIEIISGPVVNDDQTMVAYIESDGDLVTRSEDGQTTVATGLGVNSQLSEVTGGPDCTVDACQVYVDDSTLGEPRVFDETGAATVAVPGALGVQDADDAGLATVINKSLGEGSCGGVYDRAAGAYLWEGCDYYVFDLAPGSRHVSATHPYLDGFGHAWEAILDARTGQEVARFDPSDGVIVNSEWQDSEHLLATVYEFDPGRWSVYRIGLDGTAEQVLGPKKGSDFRPEWALLEN
jgi:hypothetical protein